MVELGGHMLTKDARTMRVFISSTFRDMQAERDHLIKFIFPQLRKKCEERGVAWSEVDLRWGITDEQADEGQVLPICLEEIHNCRPYFIGILGERYGWVPAEIDPNLIALQPWLVEHEERSVTELEILHGVLNNPDMEQQAFFYFRDPQTVGEENADFLEMPSSEEIEKYGQEQAERRAEKRRANLLALKDRIRGSAFPVKEGFGTPQELGDWVLQDLTGVIDRLYPEEDMPDALALERAQQAAFAGRRQRVYVGGGKYYPRLDKAAEGGKPLVVTGEAGIGKSALLVNWSRHYQQEHADVFVLTHIIGSTTESSDLNGMLRRLMGELKVHFDLPDDVPEKLDDLRSDFAQWLYKASQKGKLVLVLDALDLLKDEHGSQELTWLPMELPVNMALILSTATGKAMDAITSREYPTLHVQPLIPAEREKLVQAFLKQYSKELNNAQIEKIIRDPQSANPLGLRIILDELRQYGVYERLDEMIERYLGADSIPEMLELVLARLEDDYETQRGGLVRDAMQYIWGSREGIAEAELLDLLGTSEQPLPQRIWAPLHLALENLIEEHQGLIGFAHDHMRSAVEGYYVASATQKHDVRMDLAQYFATRENARKVVELPWQLEQAGEFTKLFNLLADLDFLELLLEHDRFAVMRYWASIERNSNLRMVDAYEPIYAGEVKAESFLVNWIAVLMKDMGYLDEALRMHEIEQELYQRSGDQQAMMTVLNNRALILNTRGRRQEALDLHKEQERISRKLGDLHELQISLGNQANILQDLGQLKAALALIEERERICRQVGDKKGLLAAIGNRANILKLWGQIDQVLQLYEQQEEMCYETGDDYGLQIALNNQALILKDRGNIREAFQLHRKQENLCRKMGNMKELWIALNNMGIILMQAGQLEDAMQLYREAESICRRLSYMDGLQSVFGNQALVYQAQGKLDEALRLLKEQERICLELKKPESLQNCLGNQAIVFQGMGRLEEALCLLKEQEAMCRKLNAQANLQNCLGNQAGILRKRGQLRDALAMLQEKEAICRNIQNWQGVLVSLVNEGDVYSRMGDARRQVERLTTALELARRHGFTDIARELGMLLGR